jgi:predicted nucleic acid-binding protein
METRIKILIDLNIILDVLQNRSPFYEASAGVLAAVETGRLDGFVAAHSITTLFYLLAKTQSAQSARTIITDLLQFLSVAGVNQVTLEQALNLPYEDFEDAVQMMAAVQVGAEYVITRNPQDYRGGLIPAVQPAEFLPLIQKEKK